MTTVCPTEIKLYSQESMQTFTGESQFQMEKKTNKWYEAFSIPH